MADLQGDDLFLVNRNDESATVQQSELMAELRDDDYMIVNRDDVTYKITGGDLIDSVIDPLTLTPVVTPANPEIGDLLTADPNTAGGKAPYSYTYQWKYRTSIVDPIEDYAGETGVTYQTVSSDEGLFIACEVTVTDSRGSTATELSAFTAAVIKPPSIVKPSIIAPADNAGEMVSAESDEIVAFTANSSLNSVPYRYGVNYNWNQGTDDTMVVSTDYSTSGNKRYIFSEAVLPEGFEIVLERQSGDDFYVWLTENGSGLNNVGGKGEDFFGYDDSGLKTTYTINKALFDWSETQYGTRKPFITIYASGGAQMTFQLVEKTSEVLTLASDKDLANFNAGDDVQQDSGYTPQTSEITVVGTTPVPAPDFYEIRVKNADGLLGPNNTAPYPVNYESLPVLIAKQQFGVRPTETAPFKSLYVKLQAPSVPTFVRFTGALAGFSNAIYHSDDGVNWTYDSDYPDLYGPGDARASGSEPHVYWCWGFTTSLTAGLDNYGVDGINDTIEVPLLTLTDDTDLANFRVGDAVKQDAEVVTPIVNYDIYKNTSASVSTPSSFWDAVFDQTVISGNNPTNTGTAAHIFLDLHADVADLDFVRVNGETVSIDTFKMFGSNDGDDWTLLDEIKTSMGPTNYLNSGSTEYRYFCVIQGDTGVPVQTNIKNYVVDKDQSIEIIPTGTVSAINTTANTLTLSQSSEAWSANTGNYAIGPDTTPATGTVESTDPATNTMTLSVSDETYPKRWIVNADKFVKGEETPSQDAAPEVSGEADVTPTTDEITNLGTGSAYSSQVIGFTVDGDGDIEKAFADDGTPRLDSYAAKSLTNFSLPLGNVVADSLLVYGWSDTATYGTRIRLKLTDGSFTSWLDQTNKAVSEKPSDPNRYWAVNLSSWGLSAGVSINQIEWSGGGANTNDTISNTSKCGTLGVKLNGAFLVDGQTTLTLAGDKDLDLLSAGDDVEQDSGYTPQTSAITGVNSVPDYGSAWVPAAASDGDAFFDGVYATYSSFSANQQYYVDFTVPLPWSDFYLAGGRTGRGNIFKILTDTGEYTLEDNTIFWPDGGGSAYDYIFNAPSSATFSEIRRLSLESSSSMAIRGIQEKDPRTDGTNLFQAGITTLTLTDDTDLANFRAGDEILQDDSQPVATIEWEFQGQIPGITSNPLLAEADNLLFVRNVDGTQLYSGDGGQTWIPQPNATQFNTYGLYYNNDLFVAGGANGDIWTSTDSVTWSVAATDSFDGGTTWNAIKHHQGTWIAVGGRGSDNARVARSTDQGKSWTFETVNTNGGTRFRVVDHLLSKWIAFASSGKGFYSEDNGLTWLPITGLTSWAGSGTWGLASDGTTAVVTDGTGKIANSTDGINWTEVFDNTRGLYSDVTFTDGLFVAVTLNDTQISTDGENWTRLADSIFPGSVPSNRQESYLIKFAAGRFLCLARRDGYISSAIGREPWGIIGSIGASELTLSQSQGVWSANTGNYAIGPDTTPATGTVASTDPAANTMTLSASDETYPKRWIVNAGKKVLGPTIRIPSNLKLYSSDFLSDPEGVLAHTQSDWQITLKTDTGYSSPVSQSLNDSDDLTVWEPSNLENGTAYRCRVRHKSNNVVSEWSEDSTFKTAEADDGPSIISEPGDLWSADSGTLSFRSAPAKLQVLSVTDYVLAVGIDNKVYVAPNASSNLTESANSISLTYNPISAIAAYGTVPTIFVKPNGKLDAYAKDGTPVNLDYEINLGIKVKEVGLSSTASGAVALSDDGRVFFATGASCGNSGWASLPAGTFKSVAFGALYDWSGAVTSNETILAIKDDGTLWQTTTAGGPWQDTGVTDVSQCCCLFRSGLYYYAMKADGSEIIVGGSQATPAPSSFAAPNGDAWAELGGSYTTGIFRTKLGAIYCHRNDGNSPNFAPVITNSSDANTLFQMDVPRPVSSLSMQHTTPGGYALGFIIPD